MTVVAFVAFVGRGVRGGAVEGGTDGAFVGRSKGLGGRRGGMGRSMEERMVGRQVCGGRGA